MVIIRKEWNLRQVSPKSFYKNFMALNWKKDGKKSGVWNLAPTLEPLRPVKILLEFYFYFNTNHIQEWNKGS